MRRSLLWATAALCLAGPALAFGPEDQANKRWKQADACVADANKQVPDHNLAAQRKRDKLANDCMIAHKLPPLTNAAPADDTPAAPVPPKSN